MPTIVKLLLGETDLRRLTFDSSSSFAEVLSAIEATAHNAWYAENLTTHEDKHDKNSWVECMPTLPALPPVSLFIEPEGTPLDSEEAWEMASKQATANDRQLRIKVVTSDKTSTESSRAALMDQLASDTGSMANDSCTKIADSKPPPKHFQEKEKADTDSSAATNCLDDGLDGSPPFSEFVFCEADADCTNIIQTVDKITIPENEMQGKRHLKASTTESKLQKGDFDEEERHRERQKNQEEQRRREHEHEQQNKEVQEQVEEKEQQQYVQEEQQKEEPGRKQQVQAKREELMAERQDDIIDQVNQDELRMKQKKIFETMLTSPASLSQDMHRQSNLSSQLSLSQECDDFKSVRIKPNTKTTADAAAVGNDDTVNTTIASKVVTKNSNHVLDVVASNLVSIMIKKFGTLDKRKPTTIPEKLAAASRSVNMLKAALSHIVKETDIDEASATGIAMAPASESQDGMLHQLSQSVQVYAELVQSCLLDHVTVDDGARLLDINERKKLNNEVERLVRTSAAAAGAA